jgi:hypothetical protein
MLVFAMNEEPLLPMSCRRFLQPYPGEAGVHHRAPHIRRFDENLLQRTIGPYM